MKNILFFFAILAFALRLPAQTNPPIRLALISESAEASAAADVLTAELSSHKNLQLLERNEIEKVYREQGLSAENKDYLKLGQILGADGLLLMETTKEGTNHFLNVRLVAVKPGVVLIAEKFARPMKSLAEWSPEFAKHLDQFLIKLTVLVKDAIPISVVNLRSSISSADSLETERQLKLLTIQRLSREKQLFVLERQQMQLAGEEKELKLDDSAFWNGSYLLEGVVDQSGYSKETITIDARLTPPKGGKPLLFEVSGSRTNLSEVINQLVAKVIELLKINSSVPAWNAAEEAAQYFDEAKWAMRWGALPEAQAAAESAWALGKKDLDCALVRVRAYINEIPAVASPGFDYYVGGQKANYVHIDEPPDPKIIDRALHALELYYEFSRTSPEGEPEILTRGKGWNDWHNSDWYNLGIEDLAAASSVLQHFNYVPESQKPVVEKLAELRALARSVAGMISKSPTVHDSYFVGDKVITRDELSHTIEESPNLFSCEVTWGCFWQETPEDGVEIYRELMSSPVFCYIHNKFWLRKPGLPHLAAWNDETRKRIPEVWNNFVQELDNSTNVLLRMEGQALAVIDAKNDRQLELGFNTLMDTIVSNRVELVENNVELFYLDWRINDLLFPPGESYTLTPTLDRLQSECRTNYFPKLEAMDQQYWSKTFRGNTREGNLQAYEKQKQYLKENKAFDSKDAPKEFVEMFIFGFKDYTRLQALEIQPLLAAYKSNLLAQVGQLTNQKKGWARIGVMQVSQVEADVSRILNPPATPLPSPPPSKTEIPKSVAVTKMVAPILVVTNAPVIVTNVSTVSKFLAIPLDGLPGDRSYFESDVKITAHHWLEDRLLLDFEYGASIYLFDEKGNWKQTRGAELPAIAILDPVSEHWDVISCPEVDIGQRSNFYHRSALFHGDLFNCDGGQIKKYDFPKGQWQVLNVADGNNYELFVVNGHLYAANGR